MTNHPTRPCATSFAALAALYVSQGLPSGLFAHALPVFWREAGVSLAWIGALKLLALPWVLKVLWAPAIDRSLQKGTTPLQWISGLQLGAVSALALLSFVGLSPAGNQLILVVALILTINLLMATQDVVTDGLAVRWIPPHWRGLANTLQVAGYKIGMLAGGALLLVLAELAGIGTALLVPVLLLLVCYLLVARVQRLRRRVEAGSPTAQTLREGFTGFLSLPGMMPWLALLATYKIADAMGSGLIRPMLSDGGWSRADIGTFTLVTSLAGLLGAAAGGWLYQLAGSRRSLIYLGLAQALTMTAWALVAERGTASGLVYSVGILEQIADGASTVALFAVMMSLCRKGWEGTDFTVQASIQVVCAGVFGLIGGLIADATGYTPLLILAGTLGTMVIAILALQSRGFHQPPVDDHS
ncbi:MFS transporter [Marinobacter mobilis]|uniref:Major Facilitator Superfamily protein n=1 Tax=Marinobacter mobilis TaxID=488533 RepID=A0A1H3DFR6_9GAMM|nr:MFS transporter [Marinobacter mobilis]SDX65322.1 Major Facilitator Superfamily protein [Marinobacter mobilis]